MHLFSPSASSLIETVTSEDSPLMISILFTAVTDKWKISVVSFRSSPMIVYWAQAVFPTVEPDGNVTVTVCCGRKSSSAAVKTVRLSDESFYKSFQDYTDGYRMHQNVHKHRLRRRTTVFEPPNY